MYKYTYIKYIKTYINMEAELFWYHKLNLRIFNFSNKKKTQINIIKIIINILSSKFYA